MSTVSVIKKENLIKINHKKKKIQRNRKIQIVIRRKGEYYYGLFKLNINGKR